MKRHRLKDEKDKTKEGPPNLSTNNHLSTIFTIYKLDRQEYKSS